MRRLTLAAGFLATILSAPAPSAAQQGVSGIGRPDEPLPIDPLVTTGVLPNGIRYLIRVNQRPEDRAELRLVVNAGSVLEDDDQRGLAHFVEHMAFNGTESYPKQALVEYLERIGMRFGPDVNAYTSFDETVYMLTVPTDSAELVSSGFRILEEWAHRVRFADDEIDRERGVVLEEWRLGRGADARMLDRQLPILFQASRYAERLPIGTPDVIRASPYDAIKRFYRDWYRPDLMAVIAVGDFDPTVIERHIRDRFGRIPAASSATERPTYPVPDHRATLYAIATDPEATEAQVGLYFKQPARDHSTYGAYRQSLVEALYNQMLNQRLFEITQKPDAPFVAAYSGQGGFVRAKEVYVLGAIVKEGGVVPGLEALLLEAERVDRHGFVATELDRAQRDLLRQYEQAYAERDKTNSASYAGEYGRHVLENEPIPGIAKEYELVQAYLPTITLEEVNRLAAEWITDTNRVVMVSAPDKPDVPVPGESALAQVLARTATLAVEPYQDVVRDEPLIPNPPAGSSVVEETAIESVDVTTWRLGNGVRVLLKPTDFKDDEILMQAWSPGGTSLAPDSIYVPAMTAASAVSVSGVGEFSLIELQKALADKAVQVGPYVSPLYEGFSGRASPKDLETLLQLVYLYATAPRADPAGFEAYRGRMRAMLVNRDASPEVAFQDSLNLTLAQHHPRRPTYSVALLDRMDLARSVAFYRERFADASDLTFVFVGSFTLDGIRPLVERYLGGLPANGRRETWRDEGIVPPAGVVQKTVRKGLEAKSRTTIVYTGSFDDTRDERYALRSLSDVLDIRLRERLREDLGGTYDVGVSATSQRVPREEYSFTISFGSAPERAEELTRGVFDVIDSIATLGPTATDIEKVREIQRRERETSLRENGYWLGRIVTYDRNDTDLGEILTGERLIEGLGPSIVRDAAARYLRRDRYVQVRLMPEGAP